MTFGLCIGDLDLSSLHALSPSFVGNDSAAILILLEFGDEGGFYGVAVSMGACLRGLVLPLVTVLDPVTDPAGVYALVLELTQELCLRFTIWQKKNRKIKTFQLSDSQRVKIL